jgi:hypothetical protein
MKILSYEFEEPQTTGWRFERFDLGRLNLIVGDSASGKTRFLNTLFNLGLNVTGSRNHLFHGSWKTRLEQNGNVYKWEIRIGPVSTGGPMVQMELLINESAPGSPIIERNGATFHFNGDPLPKLSRENTSIELLQDEDVIRPLYDGFGKLLRRDFFGSTQICGVKSDIAALHENL